MEDNSRTSQTEVETKEPEATQEDSISSQTVVEAKEPEKSQEDGLTSQTEAEAESFEDAFQIQVEDDGNGIDTATLNEGDGTVMSMLNANGSNRNKQPGPSEGRNKPCQRKLSVHNNFVLDAVGPAEHCAQVKGSTLVLSSLVALMNSSEHFKNSDGVKV